MPKVNCDDCGIFIAQLEVKGKILNGAEYRIAGKCRGCIAKSKAAKTRNDDVLGRYDDRNVFDFFRGFGGN